MLGSRQATNWYVIYVVDFSYKTEARDTMFRTIHTLGAVHRIVENNCSTPVPKFIGIFCNTDRLFFDIRKFILKHGIFVVI